MDHCILGNLFWYGAWTIAVGELYKCYRHTVLREPVIRHSVTKKNLTLAGGTTGLSEIRTLLERQTDGSYVTGQPISKKKCPV